MKSINVKNILVAISVLLVVGCSSKPKIETQQDACLMLGNATQIFHKDYLEGNTEQVKFWIDEQNDIEEGVGDLFLANSEQMKELSPVQVNNVVYHSCMKKYYIDNYPVKKIQHCYSYDDGEKIVMCNNIVLREQYMKEQSQKLKNSIKENEVSAPSKPKIETQVKSDDSKSGWSLPKIAFQAVKLAI